MDDDFSAVAYAHLIRVLEDLKDEQATMHSSSSVSYTHLTLPTTPYV